MPLGMEVGLGPGHIVLDGDPIGFSHPLKTTENSFQCTCTTARLSCERSMKRKVTSRSSVTAYGGTVQRSNDRNDLSLLRHWFLGDRYK